MQVQSSYRKRGGNRLLSYRTWIYGFMLLFCAALFVIPFLLVISISFTSEQAIQSGGYRLIPAEFTLEAYRYVFANPEQVLNAYGVTAFVSFAGTLLSVVLMAMCAYALSRRNFRLRAGITVYIFFTMIFSGGMVPSYILNVTLLRIKDTLWVYLLPGLASTFYIIVFRTFFKDIPEGLMEAAKLDGASEMRIFWQIVLPLSKPVLATIAFMVLLDKWNDWMTSLLYIDNPKLYTLQYLLQKILREAEFIRNMIQEAPSGMDEAFVLQARNLPTESMRYALCIVAAGPMLVVFPFFQKYFVKGLTVGAVKG